MAYRISRNIESSIIQYLESELDSAGWSAKVEKTFSKVYKINISENAIVCVRLGNTIHNRAEIGSFSTYRNPLVLIDLFCKTDGQRLDLKDFLISKLKSSIPYYEYTIKDGEVDSKTRNGNITAVNIEDEGVNFGVENKNTLNVHDRYRHLITLNCRIGRIET